jgi:hypothetical protein
MNSWEPEKNLECEELIRKFHIGKKTWCYECQKGFLRKKNLRNHEAIHEDD